MKRTEYNVTTGQRTEHTLSSSEETARNAEKAENDKVAYKEKRAFAFPSLAEQLDMQYWDKKNGTTTWVDAIAKVKSDNPKP
tara:strand:- start:747 stop:992 length:246 start_codon:yes stop_codon:yes gene_type:complete